MKEKVGEGWRRRVSEYKRGKKIVRNRNRNSEKERGMIGDEASDSISN